MSAMLGSRKRVETIKGTCMDISIDISQNNGVILCPYPWHDYNLWSLFVFRSDRRWWTPFWARHIVWWVRHFRSRFKLFPRQPLEMYRTSVYSISFSKTTMSVSSWGNTVREDTAASQSSHEGFLAPVSCRGACEVSSWNGSDPTEGRVVASTSDDCSTRFLFLGDHNDRRQ